jgi:hypothetical protein
MSRLDQIAAQLARHPRAADFAKRLAAAAIEQAPAVFSSAAVEPAGAPPHATASPAPGAGTRQAPREQEVIRLAREAHYTDEGALQLQQFMQQHDISDPMVAMLAFEQLNPSPEPVVSGATNWNFFDQRDSGADSAAYQLLLKGDFDGFERVAIPAAIESVRGR